MKKCRQCRKNFDPRNSLQVVCSPACAIKDAKRKAQNAEKKARKEVRVRKQLLKTRSDFVREAQAAFNAWVRERDRAEPCISCLCFPGGNGSHGGTWDCGHYRSVGANPELRFEPLNAHKQCKRCNNYMSGNVVNYRRNLLEKIGQEKLEWIEGPHEPKHYSKEDLIEIRDHYRKLTRELRRDG